MAERLDRRRVTFAVALFGIVLGLAVATQIGPWLTRARDVIASTPVREDLAVVQRIALAPGQRACLDQVTFDPSAGVARVAIARAPAGPTRLVLTASADGYRATATAPIAAHRRGSVELPFAASSSGVVGTLCLRNAGTHALALAGTADPRALTRTTMTLDGARSPLAFSLALLEPGRHSVLDRASQLVHRAAALTAVGPWLLWLLIPLLVFGVPTAVIVALALALREPDPPAPGPRARQPDPPHRPVRE